MEFGERPNQLAALTSSMTLFDRGVNSVVERGGSGAYMMEAVVDAIKALKKVQATRPVLVLFVRESSQEFSNTRHEEIEDALKKSGVPLWAIVLQGPGRSARRKPGAAAISSWAICRPAAVASAICCSIVTASRRGSGRWRIG